MIGSPYVYEYVNFTLQGIVTDFPLQVFYFVSLWFSFFSHLYFPCLTFPCEMFFPCVLYKKNVLGGILNCRCLQGIQKASLVLHDVILLIFDNGAGAPPTSYHLHEK